MLVTWLLRQKPIEKDFYFGEWWSANTASHLITDWNKSGSAREKIDFMVLPL